METAITVLLQVLIMFLLAFCGVLMHKTGKLTMEGNKSIGNILIHLSLPSVIINSFLVERTAERVSGLMLSAVLAVLILLLSLVVSNLFLKDAIGRFASAFSNPGFFAIPIITSCLGTEAVFYTVFFVAFLNLLQWSYGVSILKGEQERINIKELLQAPFFIAIVIGLFFFLTGIELPEVAKKTVGFLASLNTPLAMFAVGVYVAQIDWKRSLKKRVLYKISLVRLVMIPAVILIVMLWVPQTFYDLKFALLIAAACPTGSNIAVYAQLHNKDYAYAVETVVVTTLLSVLTLPLVVQIASFMWKQV